MALSSDHMHGLKHGFSRSNYVINNHECDLLGTEVRCNDLQHSDFRCQCTIDPSSCHLLMSRSVLAFLGSAIIFHKMVGLKKLTDLYRIYNSLIYKKNLVHWQSPLVLTCLQLFSDHLQTCQGPRWSLYIRLIWLWIFCLIKYVQKGHLTHWLLGDFNDILD